MAFKTRFWESANGSSTAVQFRNDADPMVHLHTNVGWVRIGNSPSDEQKAEEMAEGIAEGYGLFEASKLRALYMAGRGEE